MTFVFCSFLSEHVYPVYRTSEHQSPERAEGVKKVRRAFLEVQSKIRLHLQRRLPHSELHCPVDVEQQNRHPCDRLQACKRMSEEGKSKRVSRMQATCTNASACPNASNVYKCSHVPWVAGCMTHRCQPHLQCKRERRLVHSTPTPGSLQSSTAAAPSRHERIRAAG